MLFLGKKNYNTIGVDIGTKGIKVAGLTGKKGRIILENYGEICLDIGGEEYFRYFDKNTLNPSIDNIVNALRAIISETGMKAKKAVFSLPDFSTFFITFDLPPMPKKELANAIAFEARKYIPLPMSEIVLDWQEINIAKEKDRNKILLMAIPKVLVDQYKNIAEGAGLELTVLEAEALGLKRALVKSGEGPTCLVETGYQSTNVSIVADNFIKASFSFDIAGKDLTMSLAETMGIEINEAENLKKENGLGGKKEVADILSPVLALIVDKIKKVMQEFQAKEEKKIENLYLSGGTAKMIGIVEYFKKALLAEEFQGIKVKAGDTFVDLDYPPLLQRKTNELSPVFAVAIGEALKRFEK